MSGFSILDLTLLVPGLPFLGALIAGLFGRRMKPPQAGIIACTTTAASFILSLLLFQAYNSGSPRIVDGRFTQKLFEWISAGSLRTEIAFLLDPLSLVMILVVTGVGFLIHLYSLGYMAKEEGYSRYFSYLNLFMGMMLTLVLANNFLLLFVGWEGVGLCSYLLIAYWYQRHSAAEAGFKAFVVNRIGDLGFLVALMLLFLYFGTFEYINIFQDVESVYAALGIAPFLAITLLLFVGATGKSAQIPLFVWLPDAMEGPTPVSALIHAATMVTAGVYLVVRSAPLYAHSATTSAIVAIIGALSALLAASIAISQNDIKRVLAYSTISQIGYMILAAGVGAYGVAIFHLMTHAFFKAALFMGAGIIIHSLHGVQNIRKMGGLAKHLPTTYWAFVAAALALAGFPGFAGFFSKDLILSRVFESDVLQKGISPALGTQILWWVGIATALLTAYYSTRLIFKVFLGEPRYSDEVKVKPEGPLRSMLYPVLILGLLSIIGGWGISQPLLGFLRKEEVFEMKPAFGIEAAAVILVVLIGILWSYYAYVKTRGVFAENFKRMVPVLYHSSLNKFYVDEAYQLILVVPLKRISEFLFRVFDMEIIDGIVNQIAIWLGRTGIKLRRLQTGFVRNYALILILGLIAAIWFTTIFTKFWETWRAV